MSSGTTKSIGSGVARVWEWVKSAAVAVVIWLILNHLIVQAFRIPSGSMERTLLEGDFLFANKVLYGAEVPLIHKRLPAVREPQRGDIVIFDSVTEEDVSVVKRVVGMPGDTIAMQENRLQINGTRLVEDYAVFSVGSADVTDPVMLRWQQPYYAGPETRSYHPTLKTWGPLVVPPDSFFVMGDNRDNSYDSRYWGFLGRDRIRGRPMVVYYSYDRRSGVPFPFVRAIRWRRLFARPR